MPTPIVLESTVKLLSNRLKQHLKQQLIQSSVFSNTILNDVNQTAFIKSAKNCLLTDIYIDFLFLSTKWLIFSINNRFLQNTIHPFDRFIDLLGRFPLQRWFLFPNTDYLFFPFQITENTISAEFGTINDRVYLIHEGHRFGKNTNHNKRTYWRCAAYFTLNRLAWNTSERWSMDGM